MSQTVLATKLYIPPPQPNAVLRPRLNKRLNEGLHRKLTLISASAGSGKTTVLSEWLTRGERPVAWLSLDDGDNDPTRFLSYLVAALQTVQESIGQGVLAALQSPRPPSTESILTALINEMTAIPDKFVLVLDDYHALDATPIDSAVTFLLEHMPPQMHLIIATREDPHLPLARLRVRGQLIELRGTDLRFTPSEAAEFLNQVMRLNLSGEEIAALETRTEGWIAGLQLAAISMHGHEDTSGFIESFTGSHRFVLDYLMEEVLHRQSESVQDFLLHTSILDRLCGPLCDAVLLNPSPLGQQKLEYLEHANLFIVPLDNERRWYRYHHLFAELLRQRLHQPATSSFGETTNEISELHIRASEWFENQGLEIEAFHHAAAASDVERTERLILGKGRPLYVRGGAHAVLNWLESLPSEELNARPSLWVMFATTLAVVGQITRVEEKLEAAEAVIQGVEPDEIDRDLIGRIADLRALVALLAADPDQIETIIAQSRRALEYLAADNMSSRAAPLWKLGLAYQYRGDRVAARQIHIEAISVSEASGNVHVNVLATSCLGMLQEQNNQLHLAAESYRHVLQLVGDPPGPVACEAYAGLARLAYEWNDLHAAEELGRQSIALARQVENASFVTSELILARVKITQGDPRDALAILAQTEQDALSRKLRFRIPDIAGVQIRAFIQEGNLEAAEQLAKTFDLPISQARVHLARGDTAAAMTVLEPFRQIMESKNWPDELLRVQVLQAVTYDAHGDEEEALRLLESALVVAEPEGFIRIFVDEGAPIAKLLARANARGILPDYTARLMDAFESEGLRPKEKAALNPAKPEQPLIEPLSQRELEVLRLVAQGLSNREISERLFVAVNTVKGHNRVIFSKLQVQRRTEAIARARELGLL
jgi:LuxR family transcriptional regulator, maltose regulon positive regulatory protein